MIQADPDLKSLRNIEGFTDIIRAKDFYLKKAAERKVEELKKTYGKGYSYEIDEKRKKDKKFGVYLKKSLNELNKHKGKY